MPIYDRVATLMAPPDAVRLAIASAVYPAKLVEQPAQERAFARIDGQLHVFRWSSNTERMTVLYYEIDEDIPGVLESAVDNLSSSALVKADVSEEAYAQAEARRERIIAELAALAVPEPRPPMPRFAPIGMTGLFLWSLLAGIAGPLVAAMNWRRMDFPQRFWPTALLGGAAYFVFALLLRFLLLSLVDSQLVPIASPFIAGLVAGALLVRWQRPAYRQWVAKFGVPTRQDQHAGCGFFFVVIGASLLFAIVFGVGVTIIAGGSVDNLVTRHAYVSGVGLTYPGTWSRATDAQARQANCQTQSNTECIIVLARSGGTGALVVQRLPATGNAFSTGLLLTALRVALGAGGAEMGKPESVRVGGRPAIRQFGQIRKESMWVEIFYIQETPSSALVAYAITSQVHSGVREEAVQIIQNLQLSSDV